MPKVWGQPCDELVAISLNDLGQPNDEYKTCILTHFLGTVAINGRYCPLHYKDWRLMPYSYKEEMLNTVKTKFELPGEKKPYILKSINKKWWNWKSYVKSLNFEHDITIEQQMLNMLDRVEDEQYKTLIEHWMSDKSKFFFYRFVLLKTRAQLEMLHHMGKKSFALVKEIMEQMKQLLEQEPQSSNDNDYIPKSNDTFEKVMGTDKHGHVRMYGMGVTRVDVYEIIPSHDASV
ncbi:hypothetical protein Pfo_018987 [Paulownia fortunei]|nr:hypothetical protein Pfo_018987 [Paulownia fortunei]